MLEELCRNAFYRACWDEKEKREPMVTLKGREKPPREFEQFFSWDSGFHAWSGLPVRRRMNSDADDILRQAWRWFTENENALCRAYFRITYDGNVYAAMRSHRTFDDLFDGFLDFFSRRRERLMADMQQIISIQQKVLTKSGKMPQSHGGVANLLKVLTGTMKQQGSSIKTIALVQFAVCLQAGIYIPDEFLTDVLVGANLAEDGNSHV